MPFSYPQDTEEFQKERESYQSLFYKLNARDWAPLGSDKTDHGMDYGFEYIEDMEYRGYRIYSQIKSTRGISIKDGMVLFDLKVKTACYAVSCAQPFLLFVVDLERDVAYFQCLQDYFLENEQSFHALDVNKSTIRIKIPTSQYVTRDAAMLKHIAKRQYSLANDALVRTR